MFAHLCEVVDDDKEVYDSRICEISKLIILEGKEATFMFIVFSTPSGSLKEVVFERFSPLGVLTHRV